MERTAAIGSEGTRRGPMRPEVKTHRAIDIREEILKRDGRERAREEGRYVQRGSIDRPSGDATPVNAPPFVPRKVTFFPSR